MPVSSEVHAPCDPFDLSPCVVQRLAGVGAQGRLSPSARYVTLANCLKDGGYIQFRIHKRPPKTDKLCVVGIAPADTGFAQPPGDLRRFPVCRPDNIPAVERFNRIDHPHSRLSPQGNAMTQVVVRVREDENPSHAPGNFDRHAHIESCRDHLGDTQHKKVPLLCRDLYTGDDKNRGFTCKGFFYPVNRIMVSDGNRIEPDFLRTIQDLFNSTLTILGKTGVHVKIAGQHLIIVFLSLWY